MTRKLCNQTTSGGTCLLLDNHDPSQQHTTGGEQFNALTAEMLFQVVGKSMKRTNPELALSERVRQATYYLPDRVLMLVRDYAQTLADLAQEELNHR